MPPRSKTPPPIKGGLHCRNPHRGRYDFAKPTLACAKLGPLVRPNNYGHDSIDFADPVAVKALNQALLQHFYGVSEWDIPAGYLCPPIPGRADYIHYLADLLGDGDSLMEGRGGSVVILDIGVGANCVYPIIGTHEYGWCFVGAEVDTAALANAQRIVEANPSLTARVRLRQQANPMAIFDGIIEPGERFAASICNPPFHVSRAEAQAGTQRKLKNLGSGRATRPVLNFGGQAGELWCEGGEAAFVQRMIAESVAFQESCRWFTTLVSKGANVPGIMRALQAARATKVRTVEMAQGQKRSRYIAWTFAR